VCGTGGVVEEEGLVRGIYLGVLNELDGLVSQVDVQVITLLRCFRGGDPVVVIRQVRVPLVSVAAQEAVVALESTPERPAVERTGFSGFFRRGEVPLADGKSVVAMFQQDLREKSVLKSHHTVVCRVAHGQLGDGGQTQRVVVAAREHAAACRRAQGRGVHVGVAQSLCGEPLEVRGLDQSAKGRELSVADIVNDEEQHIGCALPGPQR